MSVLGSLWVMTNKAPALNVWGNSPGIQHRFMYIPAAEVKKYALQGICFARQFTAPTNFRMTQGSSLWTKHSKKTEDYYNAQNKFTYMNSKPAGK